MPYSLQSVGLGLAATSVAGLAVSLVVVVRRVSHQTVSSRGRRLPKSSSHQPLQDLHLPASLPQDVRSVDSDWVLAHERTVSRPVPAAALAHPFSASTPAQPSELLKAYARAAHVTFSWTPTGLILRSVIKDRAARRSFDTDYLQALDFDIGDRVNGAYTVVYHGPGGVEGSERLELALDPPAGYTGPQPHGLIVAEVAPAQQGLVFVNETWMWRKEHEKKTLIEAPVGAWIHEVMTGWLVVNGLAAVTTQKLKSS
ncbi:hypothetical protein S40285_10417 [Stachybotrys chlorohalonatus IBT 40285]|uniref:Uncharacterized protein n=1 Tax=Stachybotrys chlorohalonatus (strain IBT 40285) TaxID=1283841 RepID=A0A084QB96_STAC4|nr:hypothetical protein S40285_10417 [Stachybotrys chlorohalonata IBT 40285]